MPDLPLSNHQKQSGREKTTELEDSPFYTGKRRGEEMRSHQNQSGKAKKRFIISHGGKEHPYGSPCTFCDKMYAEYEKSLRNGELARELELKPTSGKAEEWRKEFDEKFGRAYIDKRDGGYFIGSYLIEFIESLLSRQREEMRKAIKKEMEEKIKKLRKEQSKNPIQDFNLPHENTSEYNQAISDVLAVIGGGKV